MMVDTTELKPCPFCGRQPETWWDLPETEEGFNIKCCKVFIDGIEREHVEESWNTRHGDSA